MIIDGFWDESTVGYEHTYYHISSKVLDIAVQEIYDNEDSCLPQIGNLNTLNK